MPTAKEFFELWTRDKETERMQQSLFEVPKDSPSHKERIAAFKARAGIWTNLCGKAKHSCENFPAWMALLLPKDGAGVERYSDHLCYCDGSDDPFEIFASYGRIMEETRRVGYGHTERDAIRNLCENLNMPCEL